MSLVDVEHLGEIAEVEFADIVVDGYGVWFSLKLVGRYGHH